MANQRPFRFGVHTSEAETGDAWATAARRYESIGLLDAAAARPLRPAARADRRDDRGRVRDHTLRVGCLVFANDYRHPLVLAKELATLDRLSNGRVEIGLGRGLDGVRLRTGGHAVRRAARSCRSVAGDGRDHEGVLRGRCGRPLGRALHDHRARDVSAAGTTTAPAVPARRGWPAHDPVRCDRG